MIIDLQDDGSPTEFECDVAIVGAGAVGIVSAVELSRKGLDVLLLEGGGAGLEVSSQDLYKGYSAGLNLTGMTAGRYRMLGGSTNFWGGQISRFESVVFGDRDWVDAPQWPLSRAELDAYYDRVATLIGLPADFTDEQLWARVGATAAPTLDEGLDVFLTRTLVNRSMAHVFRSELEGEKVRTVLHANATGLVGGEGGRLTGVRVATLSGKVANVKARRVILACGTIEIARMLQLPLADGSAAPWASNPWLGKGYLDHIEVIAGKVKVLDKVEFHKIFDNIYLDKLKFFPKIKLSESAQLEKKLLGCAGRFEFRSNYKEHLNNLKLFIRSVMSGKMPSNISQLPVYIFGLWKVLLPLVVRYVHSNRAFNPTDGGVDYVLTVEQLPTTKSQIRLRPETDALGLPKVEVDWRLDGGEIATMAEFAETTRRVLADRGLADLTIDERLLARDPAFLDTALDYYHQMGGARMSDCAENGVVDYNLRVFGSENLYVAGAAVYPSTGFGNPTYTAMAMSLRLCDHLVGGA